MLSTFTLLSSMFAKYVDFRPIYFELAHLSAFVLLAVRRKSIFFHSALSFLFNALFSLFSLVAGLIE